MIGMENCRIGSVLKIGPQVVEQQERQGNWKQYLGWRGTPRHSGELSRAESRYKSYYSQ